MDSFLRDVGFVVQYVQRRQLAAAGRPLPAYTPDLQASVADLAAKLVAAAVARRWTALGRLLLPATLAGRTRPAAAVAAMDACCPGGSTLLHVAVAGGSVPLVRLLARWGAATCAGWRLDAADAQGVTPLHVASMLRDGEDLLPVLAGGHSLPPCCCCAVRVHPAPG